MTLDASVTHAIREWVGSQPTADLIEEAFTRTGTVEAAALSILRARRADLVNAELNPETFNVQGDYSQSTRVNIAALDADIARLEKLTGTGPDTIRVGQLVRPTNSRRLLVRRWW